MSVPGYVADTRQFQCNRAGRITVPVPCQGSGTYTLRLDHPISSAAVVAARGNSKETYTSGSVGQPYQNCIAWQVPNSNWSGHTFYVSFTAGMPGRYVTVYLHLAPPGTRMPQAYGSDSSCIVM